MFAGGITGFALFRANLAAAGDATLKLRSYFVTGALLKWIGATAAEEDASYCNKDRKGPHRLILGTKRRIANCRLQISNCGERGRVVKSKNQNPRSEIA